MAAVTLKGWNVAHVEHPRGSFSGNKGVWVERTLKSHFSFQETHRDEWSVYAEDKSRHYRLQIDIWRNKIRLARGSADFVDYYNIVPESRKDHIPVKGWTMGYASYSAGDSGGCWRETSQGHWVERSFSNADYKATFVQEGRDEWSVYMFDKSRDVHIQIDLWKKLIRIQKKTGEPWVDLYPVVSSST